MWTCRVCGTQIEDQFEACWKCAGRGAAETMADDAPPPAAPRQNCPDCLAEMHSVKLIDATHPGLTGSGSHHVELAYAATDAKRSFFTGTIGPLGKVRGMICPKCGRILLYGQPK